jgi:serine/threonine protein kinase
MARGVAAGLSYLHARQAVHQDLKSLNVLLRGYGQQAHFDVKIADFGATKPMELLDESSEKVLSLYWSAPELFSSYATTASDVYAMGMVFYELFMKEIPFREVRTLEALKEKVCQHQVRPTMNPARMGLSPIVAKPIMDLITACWQHEPYRRPIAAAVLQQLNEASFTELSTGHVEKVSMSITSSSATTTPQQTINYANFSSIDYDFSSSTIRSNQTIHDDEFTSAHFDFSTLSASQSYPF